YPLRTLAYTKSVKERINKGLRPCNAGIFSRQVSARQMRNKGALNNFSRIGFRQPLISRECGDRSDVFAEKRRASALHIKIDSHEQICLRVIQAVHISRVAVPSKQLQ